VRPQHLRDLTSNKEAGPALVTALTAFINLIMQGMSFINLLFSNSHIFRRKLDSPPEEIRRYQTSRDRLFFASISRKMAF